MITYIIPIIHPSHKGISSYNDILICLKRTLDSLIKQPKKTTIIVVAHMIPKWFKTCYKNKNIHFIILKAQVFDFLKDLDEIKIGDTKSMGKVKNLLPNIYKKYINMQSAFHNKDKGLKYFIGLLYCFNLSPAKKTKYIYLMDGDDFIYTNLIKILETSPSNINMFVVQQGYIMFSKSLGNFNDRLNIEKVYRLSDFSNVCGSNRIFKASSLENNIKRRLKMSLTSNKLKYLVKHKIVTNNLIDNIMININKTPNAWTILPNFLGLHRLRLDDTNKYPHNFMNLFKIASIPIRSAIKFMHNTNHSCNDTNVNSSITNDLQKNILDQYKRSGVVKTNDNGIYNKYEMMEKFSIHIL